MNFLTVFFVALALTGCGNPQPKAQAPCTYDPSDPFQSSVDDQRGLCKPLPAKK